MTRFVKTGGHSVPKLCKFGKSTLNWNEVNWICSLMFMFGLQCSTVQSGEIVNNFIQRLLSMVNMILNLNNKNFLFVCVFSWSVRVSASNLCLIVMQVNVHRRENPAIMWKLTLKSSVLRELLSWTDVLLTAPASRDWCNKKPELFKTMIPLNH